MLLNCFYTTLVCCYACGTVEYNLHKGHLRMRASLIIYFLKYTQNKVTGFYLNIVIAFVKEGNVCIC